MRQQKLPTSIARRGLLFHGAKGFFFGRSIYDDEWPLEPPARQADADALAQVVLAENRIISRIRRGVHIAHALFQRTSEKDADKLLRA